MAPYVANLIGKSVGSPDINSVFFEENGLRNMWEEADVFYATCFLDIIIVDCPDTFILRGDTTPSPMPIPKWMRCSLNWTKQ